MRKHSKKLKESVQLMQRISKFDQWAEKMSQGKKKSDCRGEKNIGQKNGDGGKDSGDDDGDNDVLEMNEEV